MSEYPNRQERARLLTALGMLSRDERKCLATALQSQLFMLGAANVKPDNAKHVTTEIMLTAVKEFYNE